MLAYGGRVPPDAVDLLVRADVVLTMEPGAPPLPDGAVAIAGDRIVAVGPAADLAARHPASPQLGGAGMLAVPGFVNAHQHLTGDRLIRSAIPDHLPSSRAIAEWAVPVHLAHTADDDELAATLALLEAVAHGVTFTVEAGTVAHPDRVLAAFDRVGVGGTLGSWGSDSPGLPYAGTVDEVIDRQRAVVAMTAGHPRVIGWITLVGHDLMSDALAAAASDLARSAGCGLTMHLSPTTADAAAYLDRTGRRPVVHLHELGVLGPHVLLAHAVHLDDAETDLVVADDVAVASCPWAYLRLGQGFARAGRHAEIVARGGRVALGCDSENAGDAVDVLGAAKLFAGLAKDATADPSVFTAARALHLATLGGAEALGLDHELGSLAPGKRADVVLIDTTGPAWIPRAPDPATQLVWASSGRDVRHVVASGRVVLRDGQPTQIGPVERAELADAAEDAGARLRSATMRT
jgi:5-methylthioadenosine/S-adenosylhomocysteine deaminase